MRAATNIKEPRRIVSKWCFVGWGPKAKAKPYCAKAVVDTGAVVPAIPEAQAKRLGVRIRSIDPRLVPPIPLDAQGRRVKGDYYLLGELSSTAHDCTIAPVLVFGRRAKRPPVIGREPLQTAGVDIVLDKHAGDSMKCSRAIRATRAVGAGVDLVAIVKALRPKGPFTL